MFRFMLLVGGVMAFIIGGLIVLMGIGAITGCAGGLVIMCAGTVITLLGLWSAVTFFLPITEKVATMPRGEIINLVRRDGRWS